jgi:hypothetical protein
MLVVMIITFARNHDLRNIHHHCFYGHGREQWWAINLPYQHPDSYMTRNRNVLHLTYFVDVDPVGLRKNQYRF